MKTSLGWAVLGVSGIAQEKFIPAIQSSANAHVQTVASRNSARSRVVADEFGIPHSVGSYEDAIKDPDSSIVYVSLPNSMHTEWVLRALDEGKHVLCEKPLAVNAQEAKQVLEKSSETGLSVMEGLMYRFHPQNVHARELIRSGALGEVREVRVHNAFPLMEAIQPDNIRITDGDGSGALMDMGCYVVSATRMLFGSEPIAAAGWLDIDEQYGIDVGFAGAFEYPGRRFAPISWSFRTGTGAGYTVVGSEATLEVPRAFIPGAVGQIEETLAITVDRTSRRFEHRFAPVDHFKLMVESFTDSVTAGEDPRWDALDAYRNAVALDLVRSAGHMTSSMTAPAR